MCVPSKSSLTKQKKAASHITSLNSAFTEMMILAIIMTKGHYFWFEIVFESRFPQKGEGLRPLIFFESKWRQIGKAAKHMGILMSISTFFFLPFICNGTSKHDKTKLLKYDVVLDFFIKLVDQLKRWSWVLRKRSAKLMIFASSPFSSQPILSCYI